VEGTVRQEDWIAMSDVIERAREEVHALCSGKRWAMSIPVEEDRDSDMVIVSALDYAVTLRAEAVRLREVLEKMLSPETDWENGETGVGHTFRLIARKALESTPATQKEVLRVRAMERMVKVFDDVHDHSATLKPETAHLLTDKRYVFVPEEEFIKLEEAADDYERVVKG
jgi:hypothetical protein